MGQRKKKQPEGGGGGADWLGTFNDLVTLLMVFFVLLFTMGSGDAEKIMEMRNSVMRGLGLLDSAGTGSSGLVKGPPAARKLSHEEEEDTSEVSDEIKDYVSDMSSAMPWIDASISENEVTISLEGSVAFDPGVADINSKAFPVLKGIGKLINKIPNAVCVEGHSDNVPISTPKFPSNWELSIARAVNVTKYLIEHANVSPLRLSAAGYGDSRPLLPNDTAKHKAKNRRVEIVLLREDIK